MAITLDQLTIGSAGNDAATTTITFDTTAIVASGGFIVVVAGSNQDTGCTFSGGGLSWTTDVNPTSGLLHVGSAQAPSGLASGTTLTATFGASANARAFGGISFKGVKTSTPLDVAAAGNSGAANQAWSTTAATLAAGSVIVAIAEGFTNQGTATTTAPATEFFDTNVSGFASTGAYLISAGGGSTSIAGTWNINQDWNTIAAAYLAAADTGIPKAGTGIIGP